MITIEVLCARLRTLSVEDAERWIAADWLRPEGTRGHYLFGDMDEARARLILELRDDMGVEEETVPLILSLLDQLYSARRQMARMRDFFAMPEAVPLRDVIRVALERKSN